jgi:uncharacterized linocin/CFP29 family protein
MEKNTAELSWTREQWELVAKTVSEEANRARVAASFLPLFGPVEPSTLGVPSLRLGYERNPAAQLSALGERQRLCVDSEPTTLLTTISVTLALRTHEVADPELAAALGMFRRAANVIGRVEDALLFHGQVGKGQMPAEGVDRLPPIFEVSGGRAQPGLASALTRVPAVQRAGIEERGAIDAGDVRVSPIVQAINHLEAQGHVGPYACVLGHDLFTAICTPSASLVLPRDRIMPFLDGPLLRSSVLAPDQGLLIALGGNPVEVVVGSDIGVRFLQMTSEPRYLFRISERLALRVREWSAIAVMDPKLKSVQIPDEPWDAPMPPVHELRLAAAE